MELIWQSVSKSAAGVYECRYGDPLLNNITFAQYHMVVHGISSVQSNSILLFDNNRLAHRCSSSADN